MPHFVLAGLDHVENAQRGFVLVGRIDPDLQLATGHRLDHIRHLDDGVTEYRETGAPGLGELPDDFLLRSGSLFGCRRLLFFLAARSEDQERNNDRHSA